MTFEDALRSNATFSTFNSDLLEKACINRGVDWSDDYSLQRVKELELISADLYFELATSPDFREGELSITYKRDILVRRARNIYVKYGDAKIDEIGHTKIELKITRVE